MVKRTIKSEISLYSNLNAIEVINQLTEQFEEFEILNLQVERTNETYTPTFNYKITFNNSVWVNI